MGFIKNWLVRRKRKKKLAEIEVVEDDIKRAKTDLDVFTTINESLIRTSRIANGLFSKVDKNIAEIRADIELIKEELRKEE